MRVRLINPKLTLTLTLTLTSSELAAQRQLGRAPTEHGAQQGRLGEHLLGLGLG